MFIACPCRCLGLAVLLVMLDCLIGSFDLVIPAHRAALLALSHHDFLLLFHQWNEQRLKLILVNFVANQLGMQTPSGISSWYDLLFSKFVHMELALAAYRARRSVLRHL